MKLFTKLLKFFKHDTQKLEHLKKDIDIDDHMIPIEELFNRLKTNEETGLSTEEANERLRMYGPNTLTPPFQTPAWLKFLQNLFGSHSSSCLCKTIVPENLQDRMSFRHGRSGGNHDYEL